MLHVYSTPCPGKTLAVGAQCADVNIGGHYACVIIGNVGDGNFRPSIYKKKQYLSNGQTMPSCREISHKHCK